MLYLNSDAAAAPYSLMEKKLIRMLGELGKFCKMKATT